LMRLPWYISGAILMRLPWYIWRDFDAVFKKLRSKYCVASVVRMA
jgi:hypothetical protein